MPTETATPAAAPQEAPAAEPARKTSLAEIAALFEQGEVRLAGDATMLLAVGGRVLTLRVLDLARHLAALAKRVAALEAAAAPAPVEAPAAEPRPVTVTVGHVAPPVEALAPVEAAPVPVPSKGKGKRAEVQS